MVAVEAKTAAEPFRIIISSDVNICVIGKGLLVVRPEDVLYLLYGFLLLDVGVSQTLQYFSFEDLQLLGFSFFLGDGFLLLV